MRIALLTSAPNFPEGYRLEQEAKKLGHTFITINLARASFIVSKGKINLISAVTDNLKQDSYQKQIINLSDYDCIITQRNFKFIKQIIPFLREARSNGVKVFDNNFSNHSYTVNKVVDQVKLGLGGVLTPKTMYAQDFEALPVLAKQIGYPLIFKKTNKGKGVGVYKVTNEQELSKLIDEEKVKSKYATTLLIQEPVDYKHDLRVFTMGNTMYAMERIPKPGEFRANFSLGGSVKKFDLTDSLANLVQQAMSAVGLDYAGVDILIDKSGKEYVLEVNHTPGFVGLEKATGNNIAKEFINFAVKKAK